MQLMPGTAEYLGVSTRLTRFRILTEAYDIYRILLTRFNGNIDLALAAYNWGPARIESRRDYDLNDPVQFKTSCRNPQIHRKNTAVS